MGWLDRFLGREKFAQQWSASDPAFAAWWMGNQSDSESVTPQTVLGLSAVIRSIQVISTTIADLPLKTYERGEDGSRVLSASVFDDPWPGVDGMTPFAWIETVLIHQILHRQTILWHEDIASDGTVRAYRPMDPTLFTIKRVNGKRRFEYTEAGEKREVGSEQITYIPGPSLDGDAGIPLLGPAKAVFSAAISGDKTAQTVLRRGIRLAGILSPADENEDFDGTEGEAILEQMRAKAVGRENAGDVVLINKRLKLQPWTPNNIESQWAETKQLNLGDHERLFGMPPHLLADTERQTSWGTGVSEQNLGLARYTLKGYTSRLEQALSRKLPRDQFVEFDYKGLLQGTPAQEIELLIKQVDAGLLTVDEARRILNLPPLTAAQKADAAAKNAPPIQVQPAPALAASVTHEPSRFADLATYAEIQSNGQRIERLVASMERPSITIESPPAPHVTFAEGSIRSGDTHISPPDVRVESPVTFDKGSIQVDAPVTVERTEVHVDPGAVQVSAPVTVEPTQVTIADGAIRATVEPAQVTIEAGAVQVAAPEITVTADNPPVEMRTVLDTADDGRVIGYHDEPMTRTVVDFGDDGITVVGDHQEPIE